MSSAWIPNITPFSCANEIDFYKYCDYSTPEKSVAEITSGYDWQSTAEYMYPSVIYGIDVGNYNGY